MEYWDYGPCKNAYRTIEMNTPTPVETKTMRGIAANLDQLLSQLSIPRRSWMTLIMESMRKTVPRTVPSAVASIPSLSNLGLVDTIDDDPRL